MDPLAVVITLWQVIAYLNYFYRQQKYRQWHSRFRTTNGTNGSQLYQSPNYHWYHSVLGENLLIIKSGCESLKTWAASSEFGTYRLCEQRRFRRACASAQSRQNLRCSLIQAVSQEEPSDRKPDPWPL